MFVDRKSSQKYTVYVGAKLCNILGVIQGLFLMFQLSHGTSITFLVMLSVILLSVR